MNTSQADLRHKLIRATAGRRQRHTGIPRVVQELLQKDAHRFQYTLERENPPRFTYGADFDTCYSTPISRVYPIEERRRRPWMSRLFKTFGRKERTKGQSNSRKHPPPSDLMRLFGETSLPGFRDIALSRSYIRRLFWVTAFFLFSIWTLRDISQLVSEYYEYPITVNVRLREKRQIQFPSVTICNLNIVRFSTLCMPNITRIQRAMIPDDLRSKLCGSAPPVVKSLVNFTMPPIASQLPSTFSPEAIGARKKKTSDNHPNESFPVDINSYGNRALCNSLCSPNSTLNLPETGNGSGIPIRQKREVVDHNPFGHILNALGLTNATAAYENNSGEQLDITEREEKELQENLTNWLAVIHHSNPPVARHLGHQFDDFVLHCTFRFTNCTDAIRFEHIFTPTEGNCFTFKPTQLSRRRKRPEKPFHNSGTSIAGNQYGLELVLNLEIAEYLTGSTQIGAMIMIQHADEVGLSAPEAIFVEPQQSTYIGLRMVNISRLPAPFPDKCVDRWPDALFGRLTRNTSYSQQRCLKLCLQRAMVSHCQCQSAMLPLLEMDTNLKICDTRRRLIRDCVDQILFIAEERFGSCQCPPRCQVINYDKTVSTTRWPTREDKISFDRKRAVGFQNLAKVTIYFQTMTCQEVVQERTYTTARLFSSLGGILGMYVGFSFLSLLEIFEVLFRRFWYAVNHSENKRQMFRNSVNAVVERLRFNSRKNRPIVHGSGF